MSRVFLCVSFLPLAAHLSLCARGRRNPTQRLRAYLFYARLRLRPPRSSNEGRIARGRSEKRKKRKVKPCARISHFRSLPHPSSTFISLPAIRRAPRGISFSLMPHPYPLPRFASLRITLVLSSSSSFSSSRIAARGGGAAGMRRV
ncbi:hypothetical protein C8R47DRAFT_258973 [Mycena vitilis]|nr:hypothetical protein C8R47DRAFT_258973 [Mycena vitilis]